MGGKTDFSIIFVPCYLFRYRHGQDDAYFVAEQRLKGDFVKFNGNNGYKNDQHKYSELMQAFSHFSFIKSQAKMMVVDLQGVVEGEQIFLTDPQMLSRQSRSEDHREFGHGDLGFRGLQDFFCVHKCGPTCRLLQLQEKQDELLLQVLLNPQAHDGEETSASRWGRRRRRQKHPQLCMSKMAEHAMHMQLQRWFVQRRLALLVVV